MYKVSDSLKGEHSKRTTFVIIAFAFLLKLLVFVASRIDFNFTKALAAPNQISTLDAGNKLVSRLATLCSNDATPYSFSYTKTDKYF